MLELLNNIQSSCTASQAMIRAHTASGFYTAGCVHALYQLERVEDLARLCKANAVHLDFCTANLLNLLELVDTALSACYQAAVNPDEWTALNNAIQAVGSMEVLALDMRKMVIDRD